MFTWEEYIQAELPDEVVLNCRASCAAVFQYQRNVLRNIATLLKPQTVACLGSGCLNDIPVFDFYTSAQKVYLVDWLPRISEKSLKMSLIEFTDGIASCKVCQLACDRTSVCQSYRDSKAGPGQTCAEYTPLRSAEATIQCQHFSEGGALDFLCGDITASRASHVAQSLHRLIESADSPEKCLQSAIDHVRNLTEVDKFLPIPEGSVDLVTSSMVISQFDHEPFDFFSKNFIAKFGYERLKNNRQELNPLSELFRDELFLFQLGGHIDELRRLVHPDTGKVFLSVELFRTLPNSNDYFLANEISKGLAMLNKYFTFDFETLPWDQVLNHVDTGDGGQSIIQSYVLAPK